jgi:hypothetical protein
MLIRPLGAEDGDELSYYLDFLKNLGRSGRIEVLGAAWERNVYRYWMKSEKALASFMRLRGLELGLAEKQVAYYVIFCQKIYVKRKLGLSDF